MYMDKIKLFSRNEKELKTPVQIIRIYSKGIVIKFGIEKCATIIMRTGKRQITEENQSNQEKTGMHGGKEVYKYLGILEAYTLKSGDERKIKKRVSRENEKAT